MPHAPLLRALPSWSPSAWERLRTAVQVVPEFALASPATMSAHPGWPSTSSYGGGLTSPRQGHGSPRGDDKAGTERLVALVDLARAGDAEAFGQLYDHYLTSVYRFVRARIGDTQLAEDLTAETFFRALRSIGSYTWQGRDFGAWLTTIARNLVADHYKSSRVRMEMVTDDLPESRSVADTAETALAGLTNEVLWHALSALRFEQQECLVMRFLQGLSIAETALALRRSEGAVKQLQLRAVRNLARQLPEQLR
jgi:RNA polymerase sigma-70 factor (ECF subfamily)